MMQEASIIGFFTSAIMKAHWRVCCRPMSTRMRDRVPKVTIDVLFMASMCWCAHSGRDGGSYYTYICTGIDKKSKDMSSQ